MSYIKLNDGDWVKKCETLFCNNLVLMGVSRTHCIRCLEKDGIELIMRPMVNFEQERPM